MRIACKKRQMLSEPNSIPEEVYEPFVRGPRPSRDSSHRTIQSKPLRNQYSQENITAIADLAGDEILLQ